ncbi:hypothetical protein FEP56_03941 [Burkholderia multivorans]|nr:hypothetical protein [Burkholderia multivorans]MDR8965758.1 hypothetical protein [Burkholderia multivorans]MDR8993226.1 hypothetical protein [Burkholderia multivorans]MDR9030126.1 hypothetical protein [Burkholderia multivorans]
MTIDQCFLKKGPKEAVSRFATVPTPHGLVKTLVPKHCAARSSLGSPHSFSPSIFRYSQVPDSPMPCITSPWGKVLLPEWTN